MKRKGNIVRAFFQTASVSILVIVGVLFLGTGLFLFNLLRGLPDVASLKTFQHAHATEVYSADNRKIGEFTTERRYPVRFESIPRHVILAFLAAEDSKFYEHKGIDYTGIVRAAISNVLQGKYAQGASTITQQVARGLLLETRKKEITRKVREMILARRMEQELTKNEILALYLSEIYLGHGSYGIGAAAKNYFNKKVEDLTLAEGALLAGLPQRPNDWDPFHSPTSAKRRQTYVLRRMVDERYITADQQKEAQQLTLRLYQLDDVTSKAAPFFVEHIRQYVMGKYGSERVLSQGFKIYTTARYDFQKVAEVALDRGLREVDKRLGWRGVTAQLDTPEQIEGFETRTHDAVVEELMPVRTLAGTVDVNMKRLEFDLTPFTDKNSLYVGQTPIRETKFYDSVVREVNDSRGYAVVAIGQTRATLPLTSAGWVMVNDQPIRQLSQVLKVGSVVQVKVEKVDKRTGAATVSLEQFPEIQGAILSYDVATGFVRAMVGGTDFAKSKFNCALQAKRQVGSTFKPVLYAAAMDKGYSPSSIVTDSPLVFAYDGPLDADTQGESWRPSNYTGKFEGDIPLRLALVRSMNIPTVKLLNEITVDYGIQYARALGITAPLPRDLTIGLGSWSSSLEELMRAYSVFPRLGTPVTLHYVTKIEDSTGQVLEEYKADVPLPASPQMTADGKDPNQAISPQTAYVMTDLLKAVVREGTGRAAYLSAYPIAGKTGTSNDHRDAWFVGYSPQAVTGVWLGYEKDKPLDLGETGGKAAAPIFAEYMANALKTYPKGEFPIPDDIVFAYIDKETGRLASANSPNRVRQAFKSGSVPTMAGDNILRIGEPGSTRHTGSDGPVPQQQSAPDETSDFLREGY